MEFREEGDFGAVLRRFRRRKGLSQHDLAEQLEMHRESVGAWERNLYRPGNATLVAHIASVLGLSFEETNELLCAADYPEAYLFPTLEDGNANIQQMLARIPEAQLPIWNVPHRRNPFFTGRATLLQSIRQAFLLQEMGTSMLAINGLGGMGKTQTALEYVYSYYQEYQAIFWVRSETPALLAADFASLARLLNLPEQQDVIEAVKSWLQKHSGWLLIFDNVEHLEILNNFLPPLHKGHVLLTTQAQVTEPVARSIELAKMGEEKGALFLLQRARILTSPDLWQHIAPAIQAQVRSIVHLMDGLPLALDQAGAYILETQCGISAYLHQWEHQRGELLRRRGRFSSGHPDSVMTTFLLSLNKVKQVSEVAACLLDLCAFLQPDAIPEELITSCRLDPDPLLQSMASQLDEAVSILLTYSLLHRNPDTQALTMHRLLQTVIQEQMDAATQREWAERAIRAVDRVFPTIKRPDRCIISALSPTENGPGSPAILTPGRNGRSLGVGG